MRLLYPIPGFVGRYSVTRDGRVFSHLSKNYLSLSAGADGYILVRLSLGKKNHGKTFRLNRIICEVFHGKPPSNRAEANHRNGKITDNHADNLEWTTPKQNARHAWRTGLMENARKVQRENGRKRGIPIEALDKKGNVLYRFNSAWEARNYGFCNAAIGMALRGIIKTHKGLYWRKS